MSNLIVKKIKMPYIDLFYYNFFWKFGGILSANLLWLTVLSILPILPDGCFCQKGCQPPLTNQHGYCIKIKGGQLLQY